MQDLNFCRYQLGGAINTVPNTPPWLVNQAIICIACRQGASDDLPCPSPFGNSYEILNRNSFVIGTATNIVAVSRTCFGCLVGERTGISFIGL